MPDCTAEEQALAAAQNQLNLANAAAVAALNALNLAEVTLMEAQTAHAQADQDLTNALDVVDTWTNLRDLAQQELDACNQGGGGEEAQEGGPYPDAKEM